MYINEEYIYQLKTELIKKFFMDYLYTLWLD